MTSEDPKSKMPNPAIDRSKIDPAKQSTERAPQENPHAPLDDASDEGPRPSTADIVAVATGQRDFTPEEKAWLKSHPRELHFMHRLICALEQEEAENFVSRVRKPGKSDEPPVRG